MKWKRICGHYFSGLFEISNTSEGTFLIAILWVTKCLEPPWRKPLSLPKGKVTWQNRVCRGGDGRQGWHDYEFVTGSVPLCLWVGLVVLLRTLPLGANERMNSSLINGAVAGVCSPWRQDRGASVTWQSGVGTM